MEAGASLAPARAHSLALTRRKVLVLRYLPVLALTCASCATIVSKSEWPVTIDSDPPGATITVWDENGDVVHTGPAPASIKLTSTDGFFSKADYEVEARLAGY